MDSANSSGSMSMQSSSGADEEYDSRAHAPSSLLLSPYITTPPPPPFTTTLPLPPPQQQHHMFLQDPLLSNYLDPMQTSSNLDIMWSKPNNNNQSDPLASFILPSSSSQQGGGGGGGGAAVATTHGQNLNQAEVPAPSRGVSNNRVVRNNPKKRSRASRRAPTTVLTTDTTNFRAMVQEFTGIPPPPFTSSPFPRTRFDLFASSSSLMDPTPPHPPYLLRPFPHRLLHHPLPPPPPYSNNNNSILDNLLPSNNSTTAINFQQHIPSSLGTGGDVLLKNNPLNPAILNFQNVLQQQQAPPPKYPSHHHDAASKPQATTLEIPPSINSGEVGVFQELGLRDVSGVHHENMAASPSSGNKNNSSNNGPSREEWAQRREEGGGGGGEGPYSDVSEKRLLTNSGGAKLLQQQQHYSSAPPPPPSSDFVRGENTTKGADQCTVVATAPPRTTQGMLESWINCSSHHNLS